jgi:hypothetical protein
MRRIRIYLASAKPPEMIGKGDAGDLPCRGARGTLSGGQCEGPPCLSLFPKEWGGYALDMSTLLTRTITSSRREYTHE